EAGAADSQHWGASFAHTHCSFHAQRESSVARWTVTRGSLDRHAGVIGPSHGHHWTFTGEIGASQPELGRPRSDAAFGRGPLTHRLALPILARPWIPATPMSYAPVSMAT